MAETREIILEVTDAEKILLYKALDFVAHEKPARQEELAELCAKIELACTEGMTDEDSALIHWLTERWAGAGGE